MFKKYKHYYNDIRTQENVSRHNEAEEMVRWMKLITIDTKIDDCKQMKELIPVAGLFQGRMDGNPKDEEGKTFQELQEQFPAWNAQSMAEGIRHLAEIGASGQQYVFDVYSDAEIAEDASREAVRLVHFPGDPRKPFVLICAGGAYVSVCSLSEAFPVAKRLNELGITAFALNYRTSPRPGETPALPTALQDVAAAVKFIESNGDLLGQTCMNYAICGFSAGGNLVDTWGLSSCGYGAFGMPRPDAIFSNYAVTSLKSLTEERDRFFLNIMFGAGFDPSLIDRYDVISNITEDYPATYLTACEDDDMVSVEHSRLLAKKLSEAGVPNAVQIGTKGGHGYGDGRGTDVFGWVDQAAAFLETHVKSDT